MATNCPYLVVFEDCVPSYAICTRNSDHFNATTKGRKVANARNKFEKRKEKFETWPAATIAVT